MCVKRKNPFDVSSGYKTHSESSDEMHNDHIRPEESAFSLKRSQLLRG